MVPRLVLIVGVLAIVLGCSGTEMASAPTVSSPVVEEAKPDEGVLEKSPADPQPTGVDRIKPPDENAELILQNPDLLQQALTDQAADGTQSVGASEVRAGGSSGGGNQETGATGGTPSPRALTETPPAATSPPGIDAWLAALPTEALVFNTPAQILYDEQVEVRLLIQPGADAAALQGQFEASRNAAQTGELQAGEARLSEEVGATLVSPRLQVTALTPERQFVSRVEPTQWRWAVTGDAEGAHNLTLSLYAILPERSSVRVLKTFERSMIVEVPPKQIAVGFVTDNWEWVWTVLLAPIGAWVWSRWRRKTEAE